MVVKAAEIAPAAYAEGTKCTIAKEDDLEYDLGNLAAMDTHPFEYKSEDDLQKYTRENVQLLVNHIFDLPSEMSDLGPLAQLPDPTTILPREKPVPKPKVETKWEKFAKEKGIVNRKKSRMVYNESTDSYVPQWGYKRDDDLSDWAVPVKQNEDKYADPWEKRKQEKKERISKNERQRLNNMNQGRGRREETPTTKSPAGIPIELANSADPKEKQRGKEGTKATLEKAQFSTASMGKFDKNRQGEPERKKTGKRAQRAPVVGHEGTERERGLSVLDRIMGKEDGGAKRKNQEADNDDDAPRKKGKKLKNITKGHTKRRK